MVRNSLSCPDMRIYISRASDVKTDGVRGGWRDVGNFLSITSRLQTIVDEIEAFGQEPPRRNEATWLIRNDEQYELYHRSEGILQLLDMLFELMLNNFDFFADPGHKSLVEVVIDKYRDASMIWPTSYVITKHRWLIGEWRTKTLRSRTILTGVSWA